METSIQDCMKIISEVKERPPNDPSPPFKEKEKKGENRSKAWWPLEGGGEGSWLGGQWKAEEKVFGLVANGRKKRKFLAWWPMECEGETPFHLFHFPPTTFTQTFNFFFL
jgi:hypothetical protein